MMNSKKISRFLVIGFCGVVLAGCSPNDDNTADSSTTESKEMQSVDTTSSESSSATSEASNSSESEEINKSEESTSSSTDQGAVDVSSELKMDPENILLPTDFPTNDSSSVTADITANEADGYTVNYTDNQGELAEVSGTLYKNFNESEQEIMNFMNGKRQGPFDENKNEGEDLGYGITGYMRPGLGSIYFSWDEGNWLFSITSVAEDKMDNPEIAKKVITYLEEHYLPAPKNQGVADFHYLQGGEDVEVDIRWQDGNMIYQLQTTRVPLDALEMTVSME